MSHKKIVLIIGNNSAAGKYIGAALKAEYNVLYGGYSGEFDIFIDLLSRPQTIQGDQPQVDIIINCAAGFGGSNLDNYDATVINGASSLKVCMLAEFYGAKNILHISSISSLNKPGDSFYDYYSISKAYGEALLNHWCSKNNFKLTVFRPAQLYDAKGLFKKHQGLLYYIIHQASKGQDIELYGSNDAIRNLLFIDDFVQIVQHAISNDVVGTYNCIGETLKISSIAAQSLKRFKSNASFWFNAQKEDIKSMNIPSSNLYADHFPEIPFTSFSEALTKFKTSLA